MVTDGDNPDLYVRAIRQSGLSIYDHIEVDDPNLWIPTPELERLLNAAMVGVTLAGQPIRTRSKCVKKRICLALGYPVPSKFRKTQPRFPGQSLDIYVQKSNNLQIWNEAISPTRRYVIIRVDKNDSITKVRIIAGDALARLDTTGRLTQKYQAQLTIGKEKMELIAKEDTRRLRPLVRKNIDLEIAGSPVEDPQAFQLLPIQHIFQRLQSLLGKTFPDAGHDQERNRGAALHRLVCQSLGYTEYQDDGKFPDIGHQLLEVKLQTSRTIDLGLVLPDSENSLDFPSIEGQRIRYCDVRYALFSAVTDGRYVTLTHLFVTTGEQFFTRFPQFQGKISNSKIQIRIPASFFGD